MTDLNNMTSEDIYNLALKYENGQDVPLDLEESTRLLKIAAEKKHIKAMNDYGVHLLKGIGTPINKEEASHFFNMSADQGNEEASYNYANMLYKGDGITKDKQKADIYYKIAADKGNVEAQIKYGRHILHRTQRITPENYEEAKKYFNMIAKADPLASSYYMIKLKKKKYGYPMSEEQMNEIIQDFKKMSDEGFIKATYSYAREILYDDKEEALRLFKINADKGHLRSIIEYASNSDNFDEVIKYNKIALEKGDHYAIKRLAQCYEFNDKMDEAAKYYKILADQGDKNGLLSFCYILYQKQIEFDTKMQIEYYAKIAEKGETQFGYQIGLILYNGLGGEKVDKVEAAKWFKNMAEKNDISAMIKYCDMCQTGDGIPVNLKEAAKYYQQMVDNAFYDKIATYKYATMVYFGDNIITPDYEKAAFLYDKASELKNPDAMFALTTMNYRGQGVPKNVEKAIQLYKKAANLGHQKAKEFLKILYKPKETKKKEEDRPYKRSKLIHTSSESDDDDQDSEIKEVFIAPFNQNNTNFKCIGSFRFNGKYLMIYENCLYKWRGDKTYEFDGTYLRPNNDNIHYNQLHSINDGIYKFDGTYFMPFQNGDFQPNREGSYKFDGTYLMPFDNGEFQSNKQGSYKFDGTYLMPYDNDEFNKNNKGTYIFSNECKCPFIILPLIIKL